jgi:hypothetical protein
MRATRFALEYAKADLLLRDWGIRSTIIVFGSARAPSPEQAESVVLYDKAYWQADHRLRGLGGRGHGVAHGVGAVQLCRFTRRSLQWMVRRGLEAHTPNGAST